MAQSKEVVQSVVVECSGDKDSLNHSYDRKHRLYRKVVYKSDSAYTPPSSIRKILDVSV